MIARGPQIIELLVGQTDRGSADTSFTLSSDVEGLYYLAAQVSTIPGHYFRVIKDGFTPTLSAMRGQMFHVLFRCL